MYKLIALAAAGVLTLAIAVPAAASTQPAAGTYTEGPETITDAREADGNLIVELTREAVLTGKRKPAVTSGFSVGAYRDRTGDLRLAKPNRAVPAASGWFLPFPSSPQFMRGLRVREGRQSKSD